ncbi:uncharacterized protein RJT21DRAFT_116478 [Scheffersomyces amazonensis]|uniref:uncharacterized protein n=1 Tax=Scheffersomyces amazonensis TaxID=1078765 RepID=UPI00315D9AF4
MSGLIDRVQLTKSVNFLISKYDQNDFNIFNSQNIDDLNDAKAPALLEQIKDEKRQGFELEKQKLGFMMSNFIAFCGWSDCPIRRLSSAYLSSAQYFIDFQSLSEEALSQIGIIRDTIVSDGAQNVPLIEYFQSWFYISKLFFTSLPSFIHEDAQLSNTRINYSGSRKYFEKYCQVFPSTFQFPDGDLELKLGKVSLNINLVKQTRFLSIDTITRPQNEAQLEWLFQSLFMHSILKILSTKFGPSRVIQQDNTSGIVRPDLGIEVVKNNEKFTVPIEMKYSGLRRAVDTIKNPDTPFLGPNSFRELFNQSIYQILSYNSELGFILDRSSIIIIRIKSPAVISQMVNQSDGTIIRIIDCEVSCLEHSTNGNNLVTILISYLLDYFTDIDSDRTNKVKELFKYFELTETQERQMLLNRSEFIHNQWSNRFSDYSLVNNSFVHTKYPDIQIPRDIFEIKNLIRGWNTRNENEFKIGDNLRKEDPLEKHFSKVFLCNVVSTKRQLVLKVYDPLSAPILNNVSGLSDVLFHQVFNYILEMFFSEIKAYLRIRGEPRGLGEDPPDSFGGTSGRLLVRQAQIVNYLPYLYEFGFYTGKSFSGFYLIEEYIKDDKLNCNFETLCMLARVALSTIHSLGLIHGDIHQYNIIYDSTRQRVFLIDFGKSTFTNFQSSVKSKESDRQALEIALMDIRHARNIANN